MVFVVYGMEILHSHWLSSLLHHVIFVMSRIPAFLLLLLHVVFHVSGNPVFSLGEQPSSPEGSSIFVVSVF